ncbi:MAG: hypothetical protein UU93_C0035G0001, partial [Candidatus Amesbacteria bacterium GW2011_GWA2_42_12]
QPQKGDVRAKTPMQLQLHQQEN